ncbi:MAG: putative secondary metabolism biosynthetic enzyme [Caeruleum heppii]|nr:MAG: putative secondary metabolism biosynthetic enzyme [Caeruleum heppii]
MTVNDSTIYLVTGANRGIGRGIVETYLSRPGSVVVAAVRDPSHPTAQSLVQESSGKPGKLIVVALESIDEAAPFVAVKELTTKHGITHLDVVVANAGISQDATPIAQVSLSVLRRHVDVNAYGTLALFQAVLPLLKKSKQPKFVTIGSPLGSIGGMELRSQYPMATYGASKALLNFFVRRFHFENPEVVAFVIDPGFVQTDMGNMGAQAVGLKEAFDTVADSVGGCVAQIDGSTRDATSGRFVAAGKFAGVEGKDFPF